jgi:hypothetical protein
MALSQLREYDLHNEVCLPLARKEQLLADAKIELQLPLLVKITTKPPLLDTRGKALRP